MSQYFIHVSDDGSDGINGYDANLGGMSNLFYSLINHKFDIFYGFIYYIIMMFIRKQEIRTFLSQKRVLVIYGPRRVGKTTLVEKYLRSIGNKEKIKYDVGDDIELRRILGGEQRKDILQYALPYQMIVIDEAQQIPHIGIAAKMMIDAFPEKQIILTGSSSFDLSQNIGEPLTGRQYTLTLLPIAQSELSENAFEKKQSLENFLIFGSYPEVLSTDDILKKERILRELISSYLLKDILALDRLRSPDLLIDITKCLAFQVGNEVSYNEIAQTVRTDVKTVQRYIDVLEKSFVVKKVRAYSTNQRNEISKQMKYYFIDNGVRNAVISQFQGLSNRNDIGALWENFIFMECLKKNNLAQTHDAFYFWRTKSQVEIDIIRESEGVLTAYECKFSKNSSANFRIFKNLYPTAKTQVINRENYLDFVG